jgi:Transposase DDE domain group 1
VGDDAGNRAGPGLSDGLPRWRSPRAVHDPGKIVAGLAAAVALGGDCLADIAVLREQPDLAGPAASDPVVSRLVSSLARDLPRALKAIRGARSAARERAWALAGDAAPGTDGGLVIIDLDATIVIAHPDKEQAAPTWKKTFGHHPMTAWADHGAAGNGEPLAIVLRPGNAGSDTAADHIEAARHAVAQLPRHLRQKVVVRADSGGGTHGFPDWLTARSRRLRYPAGMTITGDIQTAIGTVPAAGWTPAYDGDGEVREGAWAADITGLLDLDDRPAGMRSLSARSAPSRRAAAVHRHRRPPVHRRRRRREERPARRPGTAPPAAGQVRGRIRGATDTGLRNLPLKGFAQNQIWCEVVALACELLAWTRMLALAGDARRWEPKRLRLRLFAAAGRLARGGRRLRLRLAGRWTWAAEIAAAVTRLQAIPSR